MLELAAVGVGSDDYVRDMIFAISNPGVPIDWFHNLCMLLRADLSLIQRLVAKQYLKSD